MTTSSIWHTVSQDNPIIQSEFRYQRWLINESRSGGIWILLAGALVAPALIFSLLATAFVLLQPLLPPTDILGNIFNAGNGIGFVTIIIANFALYPVVTLITFGLSARSISRERAGHTWDTLRLTDISARHIIIGKTVASLRALNGDHGMVFILRVGLLAAIIAEFNGMTRGEALAPELAWQFTLLMLAFIALSALFTVLDALLSIVLALIATLPSETLSAVTVPTIFIVRVLVSAGAFAILVNIIFALFYEQYAVMPMNIILAIIGYLIVIPLALITAERLVR